MITTNLVMTGLWIKAVDAGDAYGITNRNETFDAEFALSAGAPSEALLGHILAPNHGAESNTFPTGTSDLYVRGPSSLIMAISK